MKNKIILCAAFIAGFSLFPIQAELSWRAPVRTLNHYVVKNPLATAALVRTAVYGGYLLYCLQQMSYKDVYEKYPACVLNLKYTLLGSPNEKGDIVSFPTYEYDSSGTVDIKKYNQQVALIKKSIKEHNNKRNKAIEKLITKTKETKEAEEIKEAEDLLNDNYQNYPSTALNLPTFWQKKLKIASINLSTGTVFDVAIHSLLAKFLYEDLRFLGEKVKHALDSI